MRTTVAFAVCLAVVLTIPFQPNIPSSKALATTAAEAFVRFEENKGQVTADVDFTARLSGTTLFLTEGDAVFVLPITRESRFPRETTALRLEFVGANRKAKPTGEGELQSRSHYLFGRDPAQWHTDVRHVERVRYHDLYPGIDLLYRGGGALEFDAIVQPGADPSSIRFRLRGADRVEHAKDGRLVASLAAGRVVLEPPHVYQEIDGVRRSVAGRFDLAGDIVRFEIGNYDRSQTVTIDPMVIVYSSYVGGSGYETAEGVAVDRQGMAYITGRTHSSDFPVKGAWKATLSSNEDAYVLKVNPDASGAASLIYATYFGSTGRDAALDIAVDASGQAYVTGYTHGGDFPVTGSGFKPTFVPNPVTNESDAFAVILNASGNALVYGTFFGGTEHDEGWGIVPRTVDTFYLTGTTDGGGFPTTASAFDGTAQTESVFLSVLNWKSNTLTYSTAYHSSGASAYMGVRGLAVDASGRAHIAGSTVGEGLPVVNAFMPSAPPDAIELPYFLGYLAIFDPSQTGSASLAYATYLGPGLAEDVATDTTGRSVVVGSTGFRTFPTTTGAFDTTCEDFHPPNNANFGCLRDGFVMTIDPAASGVASLVRSTRLGGVRNESANGVAINGDGNIVVTGSTESADFPVVDPIAGIAQSPDGEEDVFLTILSPTLSNVLFSTRFGGVATSTGGSGREEGEAVALAPDGALCVAGDTTATDFPIARAFDATLGGATDAFVVKIGPAPRRCYDVRVPVAPLDVPFVWEPPSELCLSRPLDPRTFPDECPPPECPRCGPSLSPDVLIGEMPLTLAELYREAGPLLASGGLRSAKAPRDGYQPLLRAIRRAPEGRYFTAAMKKELVGRLERQGVAPLPQVQLRRRMTEALNAMELDWRTGNVTDPAVNVRETPRAKTGEFRALTALTADGAATVALRPGIPARPRGVSIGWPLVSYQVTALTPTSAERADVELYVGWMAFRGPGEPRLLAWNGKDYRDVTTTYDAARGIVRGLVPYKMPLVVVKVPCRPELTG